MLLLVEWETEIGFILDWVILIGLVVLANKSHWVSCLSVGVWIVETMIVTLELWWMADVTNGVQKFLQVDMLDWKTFQNLYTNKMHISSKLMWA